EARIHLHDHVVLVEARVYRRYLSLSERVVKGVVDRLLTYAHTRGCYAIGLKRNLESAVLLITIHIHQNGQGLEFAKQPWRPFRQVADFVGLQRVLILRCCRTPADANVLYRLQKQRRSGDGCEFTAQSRDDMIRIDLALAQWF